MYNCPKFLNLGATIMSATLSSEKLNSMDIADLINSGIQLFQKKPGKLILLWLVAGVATFCTAFLLSGVITLNLISILKKLDEDQTGTYEPKIPELFERLDRFVDSLLLSLIFVGCSIVLMICLGILGIAGTLFGTILSSALLSVAAFVAAQILESEDGTKPVDCFTRSINLVKSAPLKSFMIGAVIGVTFAVPGVLPSLLSLVAYFVLMPVSFCISRVLFKRISE